jgi:16S rRNA (guanine966-N2)-methyltransferase
MRIIAGTLGSRKLEAPPGLSTRPTSDRLRETLFNVLSPRINLVSGGATFLDLYAGSGAVGLEALSRGAAHVTFVERSPVALKVLRVNLERLGIESGFAVRAESVAAFLRAAAKAKPKPHEVASRNRYQVVFLDPPYDAAEEYATTLRVLGEAQGILAPGALVIAEHRAEHRAARGRKQSLEDQYGSLKRTRLLEQGDAALSFFETAPTLPEQTPANLP